MTASTVALQHPLVPEDAARAEFYALLARLLSAPPDAPVLAALGASDLWADDGTNPLASAWNRLVLASRAMDADAAEQEYTDLFIGVGKSEVNLHASHWTSGFMMEKPLAELRTDLAQLGLARQAGVSTLEDNLGALCETMRILVAGAGARPPVPLPIQRVFFERHIEPWAQECCAAICQSPVANYYRRVAEFASLYLAVERDSLAID
jgi:TorA maturation chaperone TorD